MSVYLPCAEVTGLRDFATGRPLIAVLQEDHRPPGARGCKMLAAIAIVRNDQAAVAELAAELRRAGHGVAEFTDPMAFLDAMDAAGAVGALKVLITDVVFPPGKPSGFSICNMMAIKHKGVRTVFTGNSTFEATATALGEFIPLPTSTSRLFAIVVGLLRH